MRSLTAASALLRTARSHASRDRILTELGFPNPLRPLDAALCQWLGVIAHVTRGPHALRALVVDIPANANPRDTLATIAHRLAIRAPQMLWMIVATQQESTLFAIATWSAHTTHPRVSALITHTDRIVDSDAETLCALSAARTIENDVLRHARWLDTLGREAVTRRFFRAIERAITTMATTMAMTPVPTRATPPTAHDARTLAILYASRILFLSFLETKGWLNGDFGFLVNGFADCMATGGRYHHRVLEPLFFGTLNTRPSARATRAHAFGKIPFLNGGLFTRTALERRLRHATLPDDALGNLYGDVITRYRFTAREDSSSWSEAAIDPEMLGKVFEALMATSDRKRSGAFYTPHTLVERTTLAALTHALATPTIPESVVEHALTGTLPDNHTRAALLDRTATLRILDPACGSGAFLVHTLERLATLRSHLGDLRPIAAIRRALLTSSIYGVDINPTAVWLCELRLWLSVVIESQERNPTRVLPLPNLDHQIRIGDSLTGGTFDGTIDLQTARTISAQRHRYARATGPRKRSLAKTLDRAERTRALYYLDRSLTTLTATRRELVCAHRTHDLFARRHTLTSATRTQLATLRTDIRRLRAQRRSLADGAALPFTFATHFADVAASGGFDLVIGNPPWVRLHQIEPELRLALRNTFTTFRNAAWQPGATAAHAGIGFAAQVDLATLFLERSTELLAQPGAPPNTPSNTPPNTQHGTIALLLPAKLWRSLAGGGARRLLHDRLTPVVLDDVSEAAPAFDAATYPSLLVARTRSTPERPPLHVAVHRRTSIKRWTTSPQSLTLDATLGSPWLIIPPDVRHAFDALTHAGTPLAHTPLGRPLLGVKSGCNHAFIVTTPPEKAEAEEKENTDPSLVTITANNRTAKIERSLLRPLLRGEAVRPWSAHAPTTHMIWPYDEHAVALPKLPPYAAAWLAPWQRTLEQRTDLHHATHRTRWWSLFRTDAARTTHARVVWSDIGKFPRAMVLPPNDPTIPLNTCYVLPCQTIQDAHTLAALLNAPLIAAWLSALAEPARGGYRRYLGWTMSLLPIPKNWPHAQALLAPLAERAIAGNPPPLATLHAATLDAFGLDANTVTPLLIWHAS